VDQWKGVNRSYGWEILSFPPEISKSFVLLCVQKSNFALSNSDLKNIIAEQLVKERLWVVVISVSGKGGSGEREHEFVTSF
jgi:hypothetical protein